MTILLILIAFKKISQLYLKVF